HAAGPIAHLPDGLELRCLLRAHIVIPHGSLARDVAVRFLGPVSGARTREHDRSVARLLLILPTATYRAADFLDAAAQVGAEVVVASERRQVLADTMKDRFLQIDLRRPDAAADAIVDLSQQRPIDGIVAVDDQGVMAATCAAPRVVAPPYLCAISGVSRADDAAGANLAGDRVRAILADAGEDPDRLLVEAYVPGVEVAVEGLLRGGAMETLAVFDKPDPL